ncbi:exodeoxyribonuclease VII small subunit [Candidatus Scalindua japonica]|uniref:Exodeoxyribonuclease 7 small subunit n=1 Tax=Candidatus Scalindua japonica TaxID=1284222 RepID=A0A286U194_9BACT|nr:exodeoxyribonuclease VII small subunit [Candidatus Scalindua japonica]GAX61892.1 exodeoxyribonuclease VII small subunit [Candidatus Scalindua japonica]
MKKPDFETSLKELEEIVEQLETNELTLDETLAKYESGIKIYKQCYQVLEKAEKKINILLKNSIGETRTEEFNMKNATDADTSTTE